MANIQAYFASVNLTSLLIACGLVVLMFVIKRPLVALILRIALAGVKRKSADKYEQITQSVTRLLGYLLFFSVLLVAVPYIDLPAAVKQIVDRVLTTVLLLLSFMALYRVLMISVNWFFSARAKRKPDKFTLTAHNFLISGIRFTVYLIASISILTLWVGNLSGLIAGLGISSLAVALAAQDSLSNFFGSISIMLDKPFDVGDYIVVSGDLEGNVEHVGLRSTRIRQLSGSLVTAPNSSLANAVIYNETKRSQRRVSFTVGLEYKTPPEKLEAFVSAVQQLLFSDPDVLDDSIKVWFDAFAESSLNVNIIYRTSKSVYFEMLTVKDRVNRAILNATKAVGVSIAFPSVSVYNATPGA